MADVPSTCKAALLTGFNQPMEIGEVKVPDQLEPGSILVRTDVATICASDVHAWEGQMLGSAPFPRILGHEMMGRIARLGEGVTHDSVGTPLEKGDRIIWTHGFCGQCYFCTIEHEPTLCAGSRSGYMQHVVTEYPYLMGGFAEYCYVFPISGRVKVPDEVPDELASAAACALRTVIHGFERLGALDNRHSVLIQGSGPLGLFTTALATRSAPHKVIVIGGPSRRLEVARNWGATHTIDIDEVPDPAARAEMVREWTEGYGPDVVVEVSGVKPAFPEGLEMIRRGGRYLVIGQTHDEKLPINPSIIMRKHLRIVGSLSASVEYYYRALQFIKNNLDRYSWRDMISAHYPLERINEAMERMKGWQEVKPAITFQA